MRRNPAASLKKPLEAIEREEAAGIMYHGGIVRASFGPDDRDAKKHADAVVASIDRGLEALNNGCEFAPDVEPVPGAAVEAFDIFDIETGDSVVAWRVPCRVRSKHAN
jgi:hypothetical protein